MKRLLKEPVFYLILQASIVFLALILLGATEVKYGGDTRSYLAFKTNSLAEALSHVRTFGYPLFLRLVRVFSPGLALLPYVQITLFFVAAIFFHSALRIYGFSKWTAFAAATPLIYLRLLRDLGRIVQADLPGASLGIVSVGLLFITVARPRSAWAWAGLSVSVFLTYQVRPVYLFLVPLFPLLVLLLSALREPPLRWARPLKRIFVGVLCGTFIPFLLFGLLRLAVVGHFGLVSFTGVNLMGITTQFLTKDIVKKFDKDLQPIAREMISIRDRKKIGVPPGMRMIPLTIFSHYYNTLQVEVFVALTDKLFHENLYSRKRFPGGEPPEDFVAKVNRLALRLWFSTLVARPGVHLLYYLKSFLYQVSFTLYVEGLITGLLILLFIGHIVRTLYGLAQGARERPSRTNSEELRCFKALFIVSLSYYLGNILVLTALVAPVGRLIMASAVLIPGALTAALFVTVRETLDLRARAKCPDTLPSP